MAYGLTPNKVLATSGGASLPVLGFHYMSLAVFAATLLFAGVAVLSLVPRVRRGRGRR